MVPFHYCPCSHSKQVDTLGEGRRGGEGERGGREEGGREDGGMEGGKRKSHMDEVDQHRAQVSEGGTRFHKEVQLLLKVSTKVNLT